MLRRNLETAILQALADCPVVFINGARQTGKSTLVRQLIGDSHPAKYWTLDDAVVLGAARSDPAGFLAAQAGPVVIDEVQRAPELFQAIKAEVDRDRRSGRFLLTGSADVMLLPGLASMLAGRMEILTLWPFSKGELLGRREQFVDWLYGGDARRGNPTATKTSNFRKKGPGARTKGAPVIETPPQAGSTSPSAELGVLPGADGEASGFRAQLVADVLAGGFPEPLTRRDPSRRRAWFASYVATVLQREVRELSNIDGLTELPRLLSLLAAHPMSQLNASALSRHTGIPGTTLKRYLALLETTFLVQSLPAWTTNIGKRLVKAPKAYLADTGLAAHLLGIDLTRLELEPHLFGPLLGNYVAMELRKQLGWNQCKPVLHHFRTHTGQEVDLVLEDAAGRIVGLEIKAGSSLSRRDFAGLRVLAEAVGERFLRGLVLYTGAETVPFGPKLEAVPVSALWAMP